jgi:hypothetical protein
VINITLFWESSGLLATFVAVTPYDSPKQCAKTNGLPGDVRRENQEPGNLITSTNFTANGAEKIAKTMPAVLTENLITDKKDGYRENDHSDKEQAEEQAQLAEHDMS